MPIVRAGNRTQWVSINLDMINEIKNADALAVWVYLLAKPDNWVVHTSQVRKELGIGRDRMKKAVGRLAELGLWVSCYSRDQYTGKLNGRLITVHEEPHYRTIGNPYVRLTEASETTPILINDDDTKHKNNKKVKTTNPWVNEKLNFTACFGLELPVVAQSLIDETRLCAVLKKEGVTDTDRVRRVVGEWVGMAERGFNGDPVSALIYLCRSSIYPTKEGDENLPKFI